MQCYPHALANSALLRLAFQGAAQLAALLITVSFVAAANHAQVMDSWEESYPAQPYEHAPYGDQAYGDQAYGGQHGVGCDGCSACSSDCDAMYGHAGGCDGCGSCGPQSFCGMLLENLSLFGGLEGSKQPQDFGVNANFGGRFHANMGIPLVSACGLGLQIGTATNYTDNAVQVFERVEGTSERFQSFTTVGLFQRLDCGLAWGFGYDYLYQDYYDEFNLGQWRGDISYRLDACNEIGTWFSFGGQSDPGFFATIPMELDPIAQGNVYIRRTWENDAQTTFWLGMAEGHGEVNVALGDLPPVGNRLVFGADIFVPLSPKLALFGQANFITPADSGTVDSFLGVAYFPGGSHGARERRFAPKLSVASSTTFANNFKR